MKEKIERRLKDIERGIDGSLIELHIVSDQNESIVGMVGHFKLTGHSSRLIAEAMKQSEGFRRAVISAITQLSTPKISS